MGDLQGTKDGREQLAGDVMEYVKRRLLLRLRYFGQALYALVQRGDEGIDSIGTDGRLLYYNADYVIRTFRSDQNRMSRAYLHTLLHCIFRHFDVRRDIIRQVWDICCDIAVENMILEMRLSDMRLREEEEQLRRIAGLAGRMRLLSAERLYHCLLENPALCQELLLCRTLFLRDEHSRWYQSDPDSGKGRLAEEEIEAAVFEDLDVTDPDELRLLPKVRLADQWKKIADIIKIDLETESLNKGSHAGSLVRQLRAAGLDRVDYREFLRKFARPQEYLGANPEEFDYVYYTYGLQLYRDMPLIEPLEYREGDQIREFVIALDTSGSISQEHLRRFLESTLSILREGETLHRKIRLYILQCDAQLQNVIRIDAEQQLRTLPRELTIYGGGGTDFRPVFEYLAQLREEGALQGPDGLLYFTDGLGTYPAQPPACQTAFIFTEPEGMLQEEFPPWAMRMLLTQEQLSQL